MAKSKSVKKVAKPRPVPADITPDGMKWVQGIQLMKGDVLRMIVENEQHSKFGQYAYAVCDGGGFGCNPSSLGNAIFVHDEGFDFNEVFSHRLDVPQKEPVEKDEDGNEVIVLFQDPRKAPAREPGFYRSCDSDRWERFWGISVLRPA
jgi:hypothetical protein